MNAVAKCPACGAFRQSFEALCPECGYEFTDIQTSGTLQNFADKIDEYDRMIVQNNANKPSHKIGFWGVLGWIFLFPIMFAFFIIKKLKAKHEALEGYDKLKSEAISNYPVPNSKNDLLEFAFLIDTKVKPVNYFNALSSTGMEIQKWNKVWNDKARHIDNKAQMALKEDPHALNQLRGTLQKGYDQMAANERIQWIMMGALAVLFVIFIIWAF